MLCEICQEREATVHTTQIAGDVQKVRNLCDTCFQAAEPAQARGLAEALQAGCRYCGGEPYVGGGSHVPGSSGVREISFMCRPCTEEYYRFLDQRVPGFVECARTATVTDDLRARLRTSDLSAIFAEIEDHMKRWVAERS
jgi:protein-arginine kinase activator protein McsA